MFLWNLLYGVGVTLIDKEQHFGISNVGQVKNLNFKLVYEYVECFNELIPVNFSDDSYKLEL